MNYCNAKSQLGNNHNLKVGRGGVCRCQEGNAQDDGAAVRYQNSQLVELIADFEFAKQAKDDHSLDTMCGTPGYVAPEILRKERYGTKADMWSMGVIVFILMGGYPPFHSDNLRELLRLTKAGKFEFDPEYWGEISTGAKDMISSMLDTDPEKRASAEDILGHP